VSELYIGLMSGTSLDGVDAALVDFSQGPGGRLLHTAFVPYPSTIRTEALALNSPGENEIHRAAILAGAIGTLYLEAVQTLLRASGARPDQIAAIGCHGQTIRHRPDSGYTTQICHPASLAEHSGITIVADFRMRDIAAGGQGAPLVPAFHAACFRDSAQHRVILNLGGIANVTDLPPAGQIRGFDTGPGNLLMDMWCAQHRGTTYDAAGAWAAGGAVIGPMLEAMLAEPYFASPPPKSTGRDDFHAAWLMRFAPDRYAPADVQATLLELTAASVAEALRDHCPGATALYVCGGGAGNIRLLERLRARLAPQGIAVQTTAALGLDPDWVEAVAFAWLARQTLRGLPGNLPEVTGARGPRILGAIYPA
jgi:anhydro-N-acetylmuramic acid kinase